MSVVTCAELRAWLELQSTNRTQGEHTLAWLASQIPVRPFAESDAQSHGVLRTAVRDYSRNAMDRLIAAHAVNADLTLVTNNESDFRDYPGLSLENWGAWVGNQAPRHVASLARSVFATPFHTPLPGMLSFTTCSVHSRNDGTCV